MGASVVALPAGAWAAEVVWRQVAVRVYHTGTLSAPEEAHALRVAEDTLRPAVVRLRWVRCHDEPDVECRQPPGRADVVLRLVRARDGVRRPGAVALGETLVDTRLGAATLATVYVDRVEDAARAASVAVAPLLGRAIAHELVHAVAGSRAHARRGLMRSLWSAREIARNHPGDWAVGRWGQSVLTNGS